MWGKSIEDEALHRAVAEALRGYVEELGVSTFNVAFYVPPLGPADEDWSGFPVVVRLVDRGDPASRTSDMGAMELYAASVVASGPVRRRPDAGPGTPRTLKPGKSEVNSPCTRPCRLFGF